MQELQFLHSARCLMLIDICMKFREDSLRGFQVTERTRFVTDGQTDGRIDARGKPICLPTLKGGDITLLHPVLHVLISILLLRKAKNCALTSPCLSRKFFPNSDPR